MKNDQQGAADATPKTSPSQFSIEPPSPSAFGGEDGINEKIREMDKFIHHYTWSAGAQASDARYQECAPQRKEFDRLHRVRDDWARTDGYQEYRRQYERWEEQKTAFESPARNAELRAALPREFSDLMRQRRSIPDKVSGIPDRYKSVNLFDLGFDQPDYLRCADHLLTLYPLRYGPPYESASSTKKLNSLIALVGKRGVGKTHLACGLLNLFQAGIRGNSLYRRAADLFTELKSTFNDKSYSQKEIIQQWAEAEFLVVDEVQERAGTAFEDTLLVNLIDQRYGNMRPTLLVSNLESEQLGSNLGDSIASRLQECGGIIEAKWPSFRAL